MKIKFEGIMMLLSVLICGGGIDAGSKMQTIIGFVMFLIFAGGVAIEGIKEDIKHNDYCNDASYPCFLKK